MPPKIFDYVATPLAAGAGAFLQTGNIIAAGVAAGVTAAANVVVNKQISKSN